MLNDSIDNFRLEINKPSLRGAFYVRVGDTRARTIHITLVNNGKTVDLSNATICELLIKKADGNQCDQTMVRVGNELQYTLRTQDINAVGEAICNVMVTFSDGAILTSPSFSIWVYQKEVDQALEKSTNEYTALSTIITDVAEIKQDITDFVTAKEVSITDLEAKASNSATASATSANASALSAEEASDSATAASSSETNCSSYADTVAGLAVTVGNDRTVVETLKSQVDADKVIIDGYVDEITGIAATKMDKNNPIGTGTLTIPAITVRDVTVNNDIAIKFSAISGKTGYYLVGGAIEDVTEKVYRELVPEISGIQSSISSLNENKADIRDGELYTPNLVGASLENVTSFEILNGATIHSGTIYTDTIRPYGSDINAPVEVWGDLCVNKEIHAQYRVENVGKSITEMKTDIDALKSRTLSLTSSSPLASSSASNILGLDALGKSTQDGTPTPTNPISIVDASKDVNCRTVNLCHDAVIGKAWDFTDNSGRAYYNIVVKPNTTYTLMCDGDISTITHIFPYELADASGKTLVKDNGNKISAMPFTFTTQSGTNCVRLAIVSSSTMTQTKLDNVKACFTEGTSTDYVAYQSNKITLPYTLRSVGTVKDELVVNEDGSGKLIRRVGTVTFDGTESWSALSNRNCIMMANPSDGKSDDLSAIYMMANRVSGVSWNTFTNNGNNQICRANGYTFMRYGDAPSDVSASKTLMASNPISVYYVLATPTETTLTSTEVASILALKTYNGTTIVDSEMDVDVTYAGDVKSYIDGKFDFLYELIRSYHPEEEISVLSEVSDDE